MLAFDIKVLLSTGCDVIFGHDMILLWVGDLGYNSADIILGDDHVQVGIGPSWTKCLEP